MCQKAGGVGRRRKRGPEPSVAERWRFKELGEYSSGTSVKRDGVGKATLQDRVRENVEKGLEWLGKTQLSIEGEGCRGRG